MLIHDMKNSINRLFYINNLAIRFKLMKILLSHLKYRWRHSILFDYSIVLLILIPLAAILPIATPLCINKIYNLEIINTNDTTNLIYLIVTSIFAIFICYLYFAILRKDITLAKTFKEIRYVIFANRVINDLYNIVFGISNTIIYKLEYTDNKKANIFIEKLLHSALTNLFEKYFSNISSIIINKNISINVPKQIVYRLIEKKEFEDFYVLTVKALNDYNTYNMYKETFPNLINNPTAIKHCPKWARNLYDKDIKVFIIMNFIIEGLCDEIIDYAIYKFDKKKIDRDGY